MKVLLCTLVCLAIVLLSASSAVAFNFYESPDFEDDVQSVVQQTMHNAVPTAAAAATADSSSSASPSFLQQRAHFSASEMNRARARGLNYRDRRQLAAMRRLRRSSELRGVPASRLPAIQAPHEPNLMSLFESQSHTQAQSFPKAEEVGPFGEHIASDGSSAPAPTTSHTVAMSNDRFDAPAFAEVVDQMKEIVAQPHPDPSIADHHEAMRKHYVVGRPGMAPPMSPPPPPSDDLPLPTHMSATNVHSVRFAEMPEPNSRSGALLETQVRTAAHAQAQTQTQTHTQVQAQAQATAKTGSMSVASIRALLNQKAQAKTLTRSRRDMVVPPPLAIPSDHAPANAPWRKY